MKISQKIINKAKQFVETYQEMIDECTDPDINGNILNGGLNLWCTSFLVSNEAKINVVDLIFIQF